MPDVCIGKDDHLTIRLTKLKVGWLPDVCIGKDDHLTIRVIGEAEGSGSGSATIRGD